VITTRFSIALVPAVLLGCSASEPQSDCVAKIAELERERAAYVEQAMQELGRVRAKVDTEDPSPEDMEFATELDFRENRINVERVRCPEAPRTTEPTTAPEVRTSNDAPDR